MIQKDANPTMDAGYVTRQTIAAEVAQLAQRMADRAQQLVEQMHKKLHPVMTAPYYPPPREAAITDSIEYPPLFFDLRGNLMAINGALESIEHALSRTEL